MKKLIVILCILGFCVTAQADNTDRIKELTTEAQTLQQTLAQYNQEVQKIQVRLIQLQAVILELQLQDKK